MPTSPELPDAQPVAPAATEAAASATEKMPVAEEKSKEQYAALADSISKPLIAAVSSLGGMLTSMRDQFKNIDPETLRLLRQIPIIKWFLPDPDAPASGTETPETPEAVTEKIQKAIVEIKKANPDIGKKLDAKLAKVTALTDETEKKNGLTILEKDCEFIAVASGVIGDAKIGQIPEAKRGPLKFEDRLSKILAGFPLEETDLTKATEERETQHAVLTTLEADVDLAVKIATHVPEAEREKFYTRLATISTAHGEGKVDDVAKDFKALQGEVVAFETKQKETLSAEGARKEVQRILLNVFGLKDIYHEMVEIEGWKIHDLCGANPNSRDDDETSLWENIGSSDAAVAWPMVKTIQTYVTGHPTETPYSTTTTVPEFLTAIVKNPAALSHFKEFLPSGVNWDTNAAPTSSTQAESPPPAA